jgi:nitrate reductase gamma subunit
MNLARLLGVLAIVGGGGVVLARPLIGQENFAALTGPEDATIWFLGVAVVIVGVLTFLLAQYERSKMSMPHDELRS